MADYTEIPRVDRLLADADEMPDDRGNPTRKLFLPADRYLFDFNLDLKAWLQFDTDSDASYFGIWVNKTTLRILSYVEGDVSFTQCPDAVAFDAEIAALCSFYGTSASFVVIDVDDNAATAFYQDRREFFINPPDADGTAAAAP